MDAIERRLIELIFEAAGGKRSRGDSDVTFVNAEDALLLRTLPGMHIGHDGPQLGGTTHCTDFYYEGLHFRHVYSYDDVTEKIATTGLPS